MATTQCQSKACRPSSKSGRTRARWARCGMSCTRIPEACRIKLAWSMMRGTILLRSSSSNNNSNNRISRYRRKRKGKSQRKAMAPRQDCTLPVCGEDGAWASGDWWVSGARRLLVGWGPAESFELLLPVVRPFLYFVSRETCYFLLKRIKILLFFFKLVNTCL